MEIRVSKKDIVWGYISIFFQMTSGIIVLPFILRMLSSEEIGYNYLMLTIGSMIALCLERILLIYLVGLKS